MVQEGRTLVSMASSHNVDLNSMQIRERGRFMVLYIRFRSWDDEKKGSLWISPLYGRD